MNRGHRKARAYLYVLLAMPIVISVVYLACLPGQYRGAFLADYGRTLGRMITGKWEFSELTEPERRMPRNFRSMSRGRRSAGEVFEWLDKNDDGKLEKKELGARLLTSLGKSSSEAFEVTLQEFQQARIAAEGRPFEALVDFPTEASSGSLTADSLFDSSRVMRVDVQMSDEDWQALCLQSRSFQSAVQDPLDKPYTNFRADISVDGHLIQNVAIRKKGFIGSQDTIRPSLKIKFDEYVDQSPIDGLDRLTLNNNKQDHALLSQYLTYKLFRKAGVIAPRSSFAIVTVNGKYLGVYSHVESVRKPLLRREFGNDEGNLYEGTLTDLYPKSIDWFEPKTNKSANDRSQLLALSNALDSNPSVGEISQMVEINYFLRYWAVESLINFWDGYTQNQNNYFIYENPDDGLAYFMPWGADSCFTNRRHSRHGNGNAVSVRAVSILANRLYHNHDIPDQYRSVMMDVLSDVWEEQSLNDEIDRLRELLFDYVDFKQVDALLSMEDLRDFINSRRKQVMAELDDEQWPVRVADEPRTPLYEEKAGIVSGAITSQLVVDEPSAADSLNVTISLEDQTAAFETCKVSGLEDIAIELSDITLELLGTHEGQELHLTLATESQIPKTDLQELTGAVFELTGELLGWSNWDDGREIRGELRIEKADPNENLFEASVDVGLYEKRGGFMNRRR